MIIQMLKNVPLAITDFCIAVMNFIIMIKCTRNLSWAQIEVGSSIMSPDDFSYFLSLCRNEFAVNVSFERMFPEMENLHIYLSKK